MTYQTQFAISQPCAHSLCGELCSWIPGWMRHDSHHSVRFVMSTDRSFYDTYGITHSNFVSIFSHLYSSCFVDEQSLADRNRTCWLFFCVIWIPEFSHGVLDPCTCTDELSCLTIWSLKSRKSWTIVKLVNKLLFTKIWRQKLHFTYLFICWRRSRHHDYVGIQNVYGN